MEASLEEDLAFLLPLLGAPASGRAHFGGGAGSDGIQELIRTGRIGMSRSSTKRAAKRLSAIN